MSHFACPYLNGEVEMTEEREQYVALRHPDLLPEPRERIAETLAKPDRSAGVFGLVTPDRSLGGGPAPNNPMKLPVAFGARSLSAGR